VTKLIRSLKILDKISLTEKEQQTKCEKCGKRAATGQDGLCDHCRFDALLTKMTETK